MKETPAKFKVIINGEVRDVKYPAAIVFHDDTLLYWEEEGHSCITDAIIIEYSRREDSTGNPIYEVINKNTL